MGTVSLVSRPFVAIKKLTQNQKDGKNGEGRIHHLMISDGLEVNVVWGGWGGGATTKTIHWIICSSSSRLQTLAWSKLLTLTSKKRAFQFSVYIPASPSYIIYLCDE